MTGRPRPHSPTLPRPPGQGWKPPSIVCHVFTMLPPRGELGPGRTAAYFPHRGCPCAVGRGLVVRPVCLPACCPECGSSQPSLDLGVHRPGLGSRSGSTRAAEDEAGPSGQMAREGSSAGWHGPVSGTWA